MYDIKIENYVPEPQPVSSDYTIGVHYFPGWKPGTHRGFQCIQDFPERTPLLGYYDESNPEVTDWEIKWALEHGVNCFIYCWYRQKENMGSPLTRDSLRLSHAIYDGLFNARYRDMMQFAIMWEAGNAGGCADEKDLLENLMPFWLEDYFKKPNYLKFDNKPVLFVYDYFFKILDSLGGPEKQKETFAKCEDLCRKHGFDGMIFQVEYRYDDVAVLEKFRSSGYNQSFAYCWHTKQQFPTNEQSMRRQMQLMNLRRKFDPYFTIATASVAWDPYPWTILRGEETARKTTRWHLTPENWRILLTKVKKIATGLPEDALGHRFIMLDNWNEWSEGHYISPHLDAGFKFLQAVREVFTKRDNLPDYRTPAILGLDPYDKEALKFINESK
jgi:hypothetical protein